MVSKLVLLALVATLGCTVAVEQQVAANPIRKVVNMLQAMSTKVTAEGKTETDLYEKFMCYCKSGDEALGKSIGDAEAKVPQVTADIEAGENEVKQLKSDLKSHQTDRAAAKAAMAEATNIRAKEAAAFADLKSEADANIAACTKATTAIEKGMSGAFLQTAAAQVLKNLVLGKSNIEDSDREELTAFLSNSEGYAPASGQITGILKQMTDTMNKDLAEATAAENAAIKAFNELMAAKEKEVGALTKAIEEKMVRLGKLRVEIVEMKEDLDDTGKGMLEDKKFLGDLKKNCATKGDEHAANQKLRSQELLALSDTIKVLNDDDALELFKKALPGASSSFVQVKLSSVSTRAKALAAVRAAQTKADKANRPQLDFIAMAIQGKKIGFDKVIKMIDEMVGTLKTEQLDDDHKKEYCAKQFDMADDKKKGLERGVADLETAIEDQKDGIASAKADIEALEAGIKALDKSVSEATEQRKEENEDFTELMASDSAAKEILGFAKNRLNKFYNPKLYKAPPKRELTDEDRATLAAGGTLAPTEAPTPPSPLVLASVSEHGVAKPAPPPEAPGAYKKKSGESGGVIAMIDLIVKDLDKEMTVAKTEEKDAQGDYETLMKDSAAKRADDSKTLADKQGTLADLQASLEASQENKASTTKELAATLQYINSLHAECDWLIQYFDIRKSARSSEIDALGKAKAVLSGADFSLVQTSSQRFLA